MNKHLIRIIAGGALLVAAIALRDAAAPVSLVLFVLSYLVTGFDVLRKAARTLVRGGGIGENFLMSVATVGAFAIGEYAEGVLVMLLYQIGELLQSRAVGKSRRSIAELMDIRPDTATVRRDGALQTVHPDEVAVGETIVIRPGERVPLDALVLEGESSLDTAALTGESIPRAVGPGDALLSGCINASGLLAAAVTKPYGESTVSKILDLVENAGARKSRAERFITRFARVYTPIVVALAVLLAVIPPLALGQPFATWLHRALSFLVISCPCALVLSVPLSFFGGIGGASRKGILIKSGSDLEALASARIVAMDKTGTLTQGAFDVRAIHSAGMPAEALLELAAHAESGSTHPISQSLRRAYGKEIDPARVTDMRETRGHGVYAVVGGQAVAAGNARLMETLDVAVEPDDCDGTIVHLAVEGAYAGHIAIADAIREGAHEAVTRLRALGCRVFMLTGDKKETGEKVASALQLDGVSTELLPADKVAEIEKLMARRKGKGTLVFVGDGINDAPVLARADIGVAMGGLGADAAIEAADVVLLTDEPAKLAEAIRLSRRTMRIARQNIAFALSVKGLVLLLSALGQTSMIAAVFADVGVTLLAVLNAMRALRA